MYNHIDHLIAQLDHPEYQNRDAAKRQLLTCGDSVIEPLVQAMLAGMGRRCWEAADILSRLHHPRTFTPLTEAALSRNPVLAQLAVRGLEQFGPDAVPTLIALLPQAVMMAQLQIVVALDHLGDDRAVEPLLTLLETAASSALRYTIITALGKLGQPTIAPRLVSYLHDPDDHVRKRTRLALEKLSYAIAEA